MTKKPLSKEQAAIGVPLLNSYAHQYLGLDPADVAIAAAHGHSGWYFVVAIRGDGEPAHCAVDFSVAKALIDATFEKGGPDAK